MDLCIIFGHGKVEENKCLKRGGTLSYVYVFIFDIFTFILCSVFFYNLLFLLKVSGIASLLLLMLSPGHKEF